MPIAASLTAGTPLDDTSARRRRVARRCSVAAAVLFGGLTTFQVALAAGAPLGRAAWGGQQTVLGVGLRVASGLSAVVFSGAALVILRRGGHDVWAPLPSRWLRRAVWFLAAYTALGTLLNAISRSPIERAVWGPTGLAMAILSAVVAKWGYDRPSEAVRR